MKHIAEHYCKLAARCGTDDDREQARKDVRPHYPDLVSKHLKDEEHDEKDGGAEEKPKPTRKRNGRI